MNPAIGTYHRRRTTSFPKYSELELYLHGLDHNLLKPEKDAPQKKEITMNRFSDVKTAVKLLQDRIFVTLISGLISMVGRGFTAAKKAPGAISN